MSRLDDKTLALLSGYAAGILSDQETAALMDAALRDQAVFDAIADDEALRQLLADAGARTRLLAALDAPRTIPWYKRPWAWTAAAVPLLAGLMLLVLLPSHQPAPPLTAEVRRNELPAPAEVPAAPVAQGVALKTQPPAGPATGSAPRTTAPPDSAPKAPAPGGLPIPLPAPSVATPARASDLPRPEAAGEVSAQPRRQQELKEVTGSTPAVSPAQAPAPPQAALQDAKRLAEAAPAALAVSSFRQEADASAGAKQKNEALPAREARSEQLKVEILTRRSSEAAWVAVQDDRAAPGDLIRLRITTSTPGELRIRPGDRVLQLRTPVAPIEVDLGTLAEGMQTITVSLGPASPGRTAARENSPARSAMTMGAAMPVAEPVTVVRRLLVAPR